MVTSPEQCSLMWKLWYLVIYSRECHQMFNKTWSSLSAKRLFQIIPPLFIFFHLFFGKSPVMETPTGLSFMSYCSLNDGLHQFDDWRHVMMWNKHFAQMSWTCQKNTYRGKLQKNVIKCTNEVFRLLYFSPLFKTKSMSITKVILKVIY